MLITELEQYKYSEHAGAITDTGTIRIQEAPNGIVKSFF